AVASIACAAVLARAIGEAAASVPVAAAPGPVLRPGSLGPVVSLTPDGPVVLPGRGRRPGRRQLDERGLGELAAVVGRPLRGPVRRGVIGGRRPGTVVAHGSRPYVPWPPPRDVQPPSRAG